MPARDDQHQTPDPDKAQNDAQESARARFQWEPPRRPRHAALIGMSLGMALLLCSAQVQGQACQPEPIASMTTPGAALDVAVVGDTAFVADGEAGLQVIDVAGCRTQARECWPTLMGALDTADQSRDIVVDGCTAYVLDLSAGLRVIDVSDPGNPTLLGSVDTPGGGKGIAGAGERMYLASGSAGLLIVDVGDPTDPVVIGSFPTPDATDVKVAGDLVYIADGIEDLLIIDVSDPAAPVLVGSLAVPQNTMTVEIDGTIAYLGGGGALRVIDVADPANPVVLGEVAADYAFRIVVRDGFAYFTNNGDISVADVHDPSNPFIVWTDSVCGHKWDVALAGERLFVSGNTCELMVFDVSTPANPVHINTTYLPDSGKAIAVIGNVAYVAVWWEGLQIVDVTSCSEHEQLCAPSIVGSVDTPGFAGGVVAETGFAYVADGRSGVQVVSLCDPANPAIVGSVNTPGSAVDIALGTDVAYVADSTFGLQVIDVSTPVAPVVVGSLDTPGDARGVAVAGAVAFVADSTAGLQIIDVADPANPALLGSIETGGVATSVAIEDGVAYVTDSEAGVVFIDVHDPALPFVLTAATTPDHAVDVALLDGVVYAADFSAGLQAIDASPCGDCDPGTIGSATMPGLAHALAVEGGLAFVTDDVGLMLFDVGECSDWTIGCPTSVATVDWTDIQNVKAVSDDVICVVRASALHILDVSDPADPVQISELALWGQHVLHMEIRDDLLFMGTWWGLHILDLGDLANPIWLADYDAEETVQALQISGSVAFLAAGSEGVQAIDVSDPTAPELMDTWTGDGPNDNYFLLSIAVSNDLAYVSLFDFWSQTYALHVLDVSDPSSLHQVGAAEVEPWDDAVRGAITISDDLLIWSPEIYSLGDPTAPALLGVVPGPGEPTYHNSHGWTSPLIADGRVYCEKSNVLYIAELDDPANPTLHAAIDTPGDVVSIDVANGLLFIADSPVGLIVKELPTGCSASECDQDIDGDGSVGVTDVLAVLGAWGTEAGDVTGDGTTDVSDMLAVLGAWGPCE